MIIAIDWSDEKWKERGRWEQSEVRDAVFAS
jgi:hypothetical protein